MSVNLSFCLATMSNVIVNEKHWNEEQIYFYRTVVSSLIMPLISEMLQMTMHKICYRYQTDPRIRATVVRHGSTSPYCTSLSLGFINYSLSSLVFLSAAFNHRLFLLSTCHLDDIVLHLWEWLMCNPQGVNGSQLHLNLTCIFTFKVLPSCFVWTHSNTRGWKHCAGQTDLHTVKDLHMWWFLIITEMPSVWATKIIMQSKRAGGLNKGTVQMFNILAIFKSSSNSIVMRAARFAE